jgi:hypothetical protein
MRAYFGLVAVVVLLAVPTIHAASRLGKQFELLCSHTFSKIRGAS